MHIVNTTHGRTFTAGADQSLLDAAAAAGLMLPYSCRTGRCSTCQCRVVAGQSVALHPELGLTEAQRAGGWILSCVRAAGADLVIEVEDLGGIVLPSPRTLPCRVHALERLADDVMRVQLRLPPTVAFKFVSGQYIEVIGSDGVRRSYSLASSEASGPMLELHIRAVDGGAMSGYWFERCRPNDLLRLNGPLGTFFLRDVQDLDLVFLCTGTGFAPVRAMSEALEDWPADRRPRSVTMYWGGRTPADLYHSMPRQAGLRTVPVLSRAATDWAGARGHVQDVFLAERPDLARTAVYACGSDPMIHSARTQLCAAGLPDRRFHSDAFVCSSAA